MSLRVIGGIGGVPRRARDGMVRRYNKPEGIAVEMVDCIIGILDYLQYRNVDIEAVLRNKHEYNVTRPYRHGGKRC